MIPIDEVLRCLAEKRRRTVLYCLQDEETMEVEELATRVLAREDGISPEEVPDSRREELEIQLVHHHLPRLAETHLIEYDHRSRTVLYTDPPTVLRAVVRLLANFEDQTVI